MRSGLAAVIMRAEAPDQVLARNADSYTPKGPIELEVADTVRFGRSNLLVIRGVPRGGATGVSKPASLYTAPK